MSICIGGHHFLSSIGDIMAMASLACKRGFPPPPYVAADCSLPAGAAAVLLYSVDTSPDATSITSDAATTDHLVLHHRKKTIRFIRTFSSSPLRCWENSNRLTNVEETCMATNVNSTRLLPNAMLNNSEKKLIFIIPTSNFVDIRALLPPAAQLREVLL
ncbi:hypothetical protein B296_00056735 [Ensete ventricosum]|uniref:Uncharacterized protein n=1 Tax=Ensete ventricosum TaxID=4639 RepID=A0A426XUM6_ENSVE|nr:hypothetical protein B296_00056735 [Ensete ventricosum]